MAPENRDHQRLEDPRVVLRRHGLRPKRSWGQNFLTNLTLVERIADMVAEGNAELAIEIGAGAGTLTTALATRLPQVQAIERDRDLAELLRWELKGHPNVEIVEADAAKHDYAQAAGSVPTAVAGNLPYHLTGKLVRKIVDARSSIAQAVLMVQLEVAQRMASQPGSRSYGVLSVMCQAYCDVTVRLRLSPGSFHPPPKVESAVVRLVPAGSPRVGTIDESSLGKVVRGAFATRRKTLRNSLSGSGFSSAQVDQALSELDIDPQARAETLTVEHFGQLARLLSSPSP